MFCKTRIKSYILIACIPLLAWFYHNQYANWHYHINEKGEQVIHAHPFNHNKQGGGHDNPAQNHRHSAMEMILLDALYHSDNLSPSVFVNDIIVFASAVTWVQIIFERHYNFQFTRYFQPRSPPFNLLLMKPIP